MTTARQHSIRLPQVAAQPRTPPVLLTRSRAGCRYDRFVKPVMDRLGATILLLITLPIMVLVCLAVYVRLGRPIFFRQPRIGRGGTPFGMLKFRTMEPDRRRRQEPVPLHQDRRRQHKSDDDPRHTGLGRLLRRCSLDELPQLWNVLRGDMSLVGPRPELASVVARYEDWQHQRHLVKPGITGLWQVTDRTTGEDMHLHTGTDLLYVEQVSLRTDLGILLRTPIALTKGR